MLFLFAFYSMDFGNFPLRFVPFAQLLDLLLLVYKGLKSYTSNGPKFLESIVPLKAPPAVFGGLEDLPGNELPVVPEQP